MRLLIIVFFVLAGMAMQAQQGDTRQAQRDSLKLKLEADSLHTYRYKKFRPYLNLDRRFSFITRDPVNFTGIQGGFTYLEKHTFGVGTYSTTYYSEKPVKMRDNTNRIVSQYLRLNYATVFYRYTFINRRFFKIAVMFETGFGRAGVRVVDSLSQTVLRDDHLHIIPLGTGLQFVVKPLKWCGISTMGGYRYVDESSRLNFNGWYYGFGLWVDVRQVYRDLKYYGFQKKRYRRQMKTLE